jgi:actin-related protein
MTEEQRMEEGRRMFQIFAARMFEQRVLQAYREKVAAERQQKLLEELAEEDDKKEQREAKRAKEAQKRKEKKEKEKQAKAEKKARKEAEQAAKEAEAKAAEEKRLEEQRKKKEEQRKKREAERKAQEEERQRKEAERLKRQQEERERQQENERKLREQKAQEKKAKEEARRKEREEREAKEKEARDKKAEEEKQRRERDAKAKEERDRLRKEEQAAAAAKKASQPVAVPFPPGLLKQSSSTGVPSPHVTPALPKAPTPNRPGQSSQQGSHGSSPKTPHIVPGASKSISPASQLQNSAIPKAILTKPPTSQQPTPIHHTQPASPMPPLGPPPGMHGPGGMGINMAASLNGFPHGQIMPQIMPGPRHNMSHGMPIFPHQPSAQNFGGFPPSGVHAPSPLPIGRGFPLNGPPGFGSMPAYAGPSQIPGFAMGMPSHSRQASGSFEKPNVDSPVIAPPAQPIQRPAPIQRPSSVKSHEENKPEELSDVDEVANHLGSKALLDDADDEPPVEPRRTSLQTHGSMRGVPLAFGFQDAAGQSRTDPYAPFGGAASGGSVWGTPPMQFSMGAPGWGNSPTSGIFGQHPLMGCPRPGEARVVWIRRILCSVCKSMPPRQSSTDGFLDASEVHQHVDAMRNANEPPIGLHEIKEACDIFGDQANGGGSLEYKEVQPNSGQISHIKFVETGMPNPMPNTALGEIGSPIPGHSLPVGGGFGARPFPGLGPTSF